MLAFMQNTGLWEWLILLGLVWLFFKVSGPRKLGRVVGKAGSPSPQSPMDIASGNGALADYFKALELPTTASF